MPHILHTNIEKIQGQNSYDASRAHFPETQTECHAKTPSLSTNYKRESYTSELFTARIWKCNRHLFATFPKKVIESYQHLNILLREKRISLHANGLKQPLVTNIVTERLCGISVTPQAVTERTEGRGTSLGRFSPTLPHTQRPVLFTLAKERTFAMT